MAQPQLIQSLSILQKKIESLVSENQSLKERIRSLEAENADLKSIHDSDQVDLDIASKDIEFLSMSHKLAESADNIILARKKISRLIRTLDNCIRMINEE